MSSVTRSRGSLLALVLLAGACVWTPFVPEPQGPELGGLGVQVEVRAPIGLFKDTAQTVYFARVDGGEGVERGSVLLSTLSCGDRIYLLNAPPGEYVAVAAEWQRAIQPPPTTPGNAPTESARSVTYRAFFSRETIEATRVTLAPGRFALMGRLSVDSSASGLGGADAAQRHYGGVIAPGARPGVGSQIMSGAAGRVEYLASLRNLDRGDGALLEQRRAANDDLRSTGWIAVLAHNE
jgi:hypothetical protein